MGRKILSISKEADVRFRALWFGVGIAMSLVLIEIGGGYAFVGKDAVKSPEAFRVILLGGHLPGGFHTHGWIMVILGLVELHYLALLRQHFTDKAWRRLKYCNIGIVFYSIWCAWAFLASAVLNHQYSGGQWWYVFLATIAILVNLFTPNFVVKSDSTTDGHLAE